jgi:hypothetical protein
MPTTTTLDAAGFAIPSSAVRDANLFLLGAISLAALVIAVFFLRFWRRTRDSLFLAFSVAFALLGASFTVYAFVPHSRDHVALYVLRLATYGVILLGILSKNRARTTAHRVH